MNVNCEGPDSESLVVEGVLLLEPSDILNDEVICPLLKIDLGDNLYAEECLACVDVIKGITQQPDYVIILVFSDPQVKQNPDLRRVVQVLTCAKLGVSVQL